RVACGWNGGEQPAYERDYDRASRPRHAFHPFFRLPNVQAERNTVGATTGSRDHSLTGSARNSSDDGIVRPSALAALRLTTSSNFVGCSMARSAGRAPFRIRSM